MLLQLITLLVILAVVGFCVYLVITYIPMPQPMKQAIMVIVILLLVLWVARALLGGGGLPALLG